MESDKRESEPQEDAVDEQRDAARRCQQRDGNREGVTDEEVEEFFAILRRWWEASSYAAARAEGKAAKKRKKKESEEVMTPSWRPTFELEDFAGLAGNGEGEGIASAAADAGEGRERGGCSRTLGSAATAMEFDLNEQPNDTN